MDERKGRRDRSKTSPSMREPAKIDRGNSAAIRLLAFFVVLCFSPISQAQNTANVIARCLGFQLMPFTRTDATYGTVTAYFTTYTGTDQHPPVHDEVDGNWIFSLEVKPVVDGKGNYATDYLSFSSVAGIIQYGHIVFNVPVTDSDSNGVPDFLQIEKSVDLKITGSQTVISPKKITVGITGTITRNAGQTVGNFSFKNDINHSGNWHIPNLKGIVKYSRGKDVPMNFSLNGTRPDGVVRTWSSSTFSSVTQNQIQLQPFRMVREDNKIMKITDGLNAQRIGNKYIGTYSVLDGLPETSWADFTNWVLEITDPTDSNGNGIPDLTDIPVSPKISIKSLPSFNLISITEQLSHSYTVEYSFDLKQWVFVTNYISSSSLHQIQHKAESGRIYYRVLFP